jgi:hypothetical protein
VIETGSIETTNRRTAMMTTTIEQGKADAIRHYLRSKLYDLAITTPAAPVAELVDEAVRDVAAGDLTYVQDETGRGAIWVPTPAEVAAVWAESGDLIVRQTINSVPGRIR